MRMIQLQFALAGRLRQRSRLERGRGQVANHPFKALAKAAARLSRLIGRGREDLGALWTAHGVPEMLLLHLTKGAARWTANLDRHG